MFVTEIPFIPTRNAARTSTETQLVQVNIKEFKNTGVVECGSLVSPQSLNTGVVECGSLVSPQSLNTGVVECGSLVSPQPLNEGL